MTPADVKWHIKNRKYAKYIISGLREGFFSAFWVMKEHLPQVVYAILLLLHVVALLVLYPVTYLVVRIMGEKIRKRLDWSDENES